jgi:wyosine [tRNA(Phe)-imidazoG37] synthetase (radical SAM superfamily)
MKPKNFQHVYGPVPSRRLGRSLGIDLVPYKTCTYDCIYCHLGRTTNKTLERKEYVKTADILRELELKLAGSDDLDYISLAGSGEPTLNSGFGDLILKIKRLTKIPVAILTNGSLFWMSDVRDALMPADLVLPSLDAGDQLLFRYVNRPHKDISFERMADGLALFADRYKGEIWLEVLLLGGVTGIPDEVEKISSIIRRIKPARTQVNTVVRPPAETFAAALSRDQILALKRTIPGRVEIINDIQPGDWATLSDANAGVSDVLSLISRRPCTGQDVACSLGLRISEAIKYLDALRIAGKVASVRIHDETFYTSLGASAELRS